MTLSADTLATLWKRLLWLLLRLIATELIVYSQAFRVVSLILVTAIYSINAFCAPSGRGPGFQGVGGLHLPFHTD